MNPRVGVDRHQFVRNLFAHLFKFLVRAPLVQFAPLGEVQMLATIIDVINEDPGDWDDVRVPGPVRRVRMTVLAGAIDDCGNLRRHLQARVDCLSLIDRGICAGRPDELHPKQYRDDSHS